MNAAPRHVKVTGSVYRNGAPIEDYELATFASDGPSPNWHAGELRAQYVLSLLAGGGAATMDSVTGEVRVALQDGTTEYVRVVTQ